MCIWWVLPVRASAFDGLHFIVWGYFCPATNKDPLICCSQTIHHVKAVHVLEGLAIAATFVEGSALIVAIANAWLALVFS